MFKTESILLNACIRSLLHVKEGEPYPELDQLIYDIKNGFINAMDDDLNISEAMASTFKAVRRVALQDDRIKPKSK